VSSPSEPPAPTQGESAASALEAAIEGVPGAVSLAPSSGMPALGGELLVEPGSAPISDGAPDTIRAGLVQAGILGVAGLIANGANVIVTVLLARLLTDRHYGQLNQLTGLFLIISMPGSAVLVAVVRRVTEWRGSGAAHLVQRWARRVHHHGTLVVVLFAVVVVAVGPHIAGFLHQQNAVGVDAILIAGAVWVLLCLDRGLLQAHRNYRTLAANLLVEGGVRTAAMLALVALGFGVAGAAVGVLIAEVVTAAHARWRADVVWAAEVDAEESRGELEPDSTARQRSRRSVVTAAQGWLGAFRPDRSLDAPGEGRRDIATDLGAAFIALAMVAVLQNIDVIMVGRDAPHLSGSYAAVSVASKALVFGAVALGGYLLPEAAIRWREGGHALRQLAVTLLLLSIPAVVLVGISIFAPHLLLTVVFGARYLGAERAFAPLVLAMVCLSVTVVLTLYLLAVGRRWITVLLVIAAVAATAAVASVHGRPVATARADLAVQGALAAATIVGFVRVHHRRFRAR